MTETRIEFVSAGFQEILTGGGVHSLVAQTADEIAARANANGGCDGFAPSIISGGYGGGRWIGFVNATDKASRRAESEDKALSRSVSG